MDEQPEQLLGDTRVPIPMNEKHPRLEDYEYEREGTASIFMFVEPLRGRVHVDAKERRTKQDWAEEVQALVNRHPEAEKIVFLSDNLNTHTVASLYESFSAEEAHRIAGRLEIHHTPKHGSWLNIAEIELSALTKQCLARRIDSLDKLNTELAAWQKAKNTAEKPVEWQFTTAMARTKLWHLYPNI
jgi:hypothetical protein